MDFLKTTSYASSAPQAFFGGIKATLGKVAKELSYVNPKVLEHMTGPQKEQLLKELAGVTELPKAEREARVQNAVAKVLDLPPIEDPFSFDDVVGEYLNGYEIMDHELLLGDLKGKCEQVTDREGHVKKALSNVRLEEAIKRWGEPVIIAAKTEWFIQEVRDGRRHLPLIEFRFLTQGCQSVVDKRKLGNTTYLRRVIEGMIKQYSPEAVEAARIMLRPAILSGMQRVKEQEFKAACEAKDAELFEAAREASQERAQREFDEMVTSGITGVIGEITVKGKEYNVAAIMSLINWVSKTFTLRQASEYISAAFANMGMMVSPDITPKMATQIAIKQKKMLAKAEPIQAFQQAILYQNGPDVVQVLDDAEFGASEPSVDDWHLI